MVKTGRISGVLLPLFSLRSRTDFGIGDFGAIGGFLDWLRAGHQKMWMMLPLLPTAPGDTSPYATRSAFGLNPLFIHLDDVPELSEAGGVRLSEEERKRLDEARAAPRIRYDLVVPLKAGQSYEYTLNLYAGYTEAAAFNGKTKVMQDVTWQVLREKQNAKGEHELVAEQVGAEPKIMLREGKYLIIARYKDTWGKERLNITAGEVAKVKIKLGKDTDQPVIASK